jgi:hypothetical protein
MFSMKKKRACAVVPTWRILLSLVLAVLFLYNPYQLPPGSTGELNVRHRASYRATVGSSELQHFTATAKKDRTTARYSAIFDLFHSLSGQADELLLCPSRDLAIPQLVLFASLWFRPPPAH